MGQTIQVKRGPKDRLPTLNNGEVALTTDTQDLYVGTPTGNTLVGGQSISSQLADIAHQNVAYVETNGNDNNGQLNKIGKPFATINAALDALPNSGGVINVGIGVFAKVDKTKWKDNVSLLGTQTPTVNATKTGLEKGTIIQGSLICENHNGIVIKNLGVDSGLNVCNSLYGGTAQDGLVITPTSPAHEINPANTGIRVENVITICKDADSMIHSFLIEGVDGAFVNNVKTYYGYHGAVFKVINSTISNIQASNSNGEDIIIKDSEYARCYNSTFTNLLAVGGGVGLQLDASETNRNLLGITVTGITIDGSNYGILLISTNTGSYINYCNLSNIKLTTIGSNGIETRGTCLYNNFSVLNMGGVKVHGILLSNTSNYNVFDSVLSVANPATSVGSGIVPQGQYNKFSDVTLMNHAESGVNSINNNINYFNNINMFSISTSYKGNIDKLVVDGNPLTWQGMTWQNGWTAFMTGTYESPAYQKDAQGLVHLKGMMAAGTMNQVAFTLPVGYRPAYDIRVATASTDAFGELWIKANGEVVPTVGVNNWVSLLIPPFLATQ